MEEIEIKKYLEKKGYYVAKLPKCDLTDYRDLARYFYFKIHNTTTIPKKDIYEYGYAKLFIKQMSATQNYKDRLAIYQCKCVIDFVFDNLDFFKTLKFTSLSIFTIEANNWIIEKAFSDDGNMVSRTGYNQRGWERLESEYKKAVFEENNLEERKKELLKILNN